MQVESGLRALHLRGGQHIGAARAVATTFPSSSALLLFYGVECALKAALLRRRAGRSTADLPEEFRTHDVGRLAKELRLPPGNEPKGSYRLHRDTNDSRSVSVDRLHEAWRYGRDLDAQDMAEARALLERLYELAEEDSRK